MLTKEQIADVEHCVNTHQRRVHITSACRDQGKKARAEWHEACDAWHRIRHIADFMWSSVFLEKLRSSDKEAICDAILFLECDPWYYRSGYLKAKFVQGLKLASLSDRDRSRLRKVIMNVAVGRNRCEFRKYCSLARVVGDQSFLLLIEDKITKYDSSAQSKLIFLLEYLKMHGFRGCGFKL